MSHYEEYSRRWAAAAERYGNPRPPAVCVYCYQAVIPGALVMIERTDVLTGALHRYPAHEACDVEHYTEGPEEDLDVN